MNKAVAILVVLAAVSLSGCASGWRSPTDLRPSVGGPDEGRVPTPRVAPRRGGATGQPVVQSQGSDAIVVQRGDTLFSLSEKHRVTLDALIAANSLRPPYTLNVGQILYIPHPGRHVVARGETLYSIARRYNVHPPSLALFNSIGDPRRLAAGQVLYVPALGSGVRAPVGARPRPHPRPRARSSSASNTDSAVRPIPEPRVRPGKGAGHAGGRAFEWPVNGTVITRYGALPNGRRNDGINIAARNGAPVSAASDGVIAYAGDELQAYGKLILIKHDGGWTSAYAHLGDIAVREGAQVERGQVIAKVGATGAVEAPQLHFELRRDGRPVDPLAHLSVASS